MSGKQQESVILIIAVLLLSVSSVWAVLPSAEVAVRDITGDNASIISGIGDIVTRGPWIDVRSFGADSTGQKDSTAAIQAAIDASIGGGRAMNRPIYLPTGSYRITRQLNFYDSRRSLLTEGGILCGDGGFSSRLEWYGPPDQSVIRTIGAMHTIRDIGIYQHSPWQAAILYDGHPRIGRSTDSSFERVKIQGYGLPGDGIILGNGGYQSDSLTIDKCYISGLTFGNAIFLKDPNTQSCRIVNCNISSNFVGVRASHSTVVGIYGGQITENNLDFWVHGVGGFDVTSVRTEYSMKTFWADSGKYAQPVTFHNVQVTGVRMDRDKTIGAILAGSNRLRLSRPNFSWGDVVRIPGAGPGGQELSAIIYNFDNATLAVISPAAVTPVRDVPIVFDRTDRRNEVNFWEGAYGPYTHIGVSFLGTYTKAGGPSYSDNIAFRPSNGPQTFIGCSWSSSQPNPFNLPTSDSQTGNATWIDCQSDQLGLAGAKRMSNFYRRDSISILESGSTPNVGFGLLFKTANKVPTGIVGFAGAVNGQIFEILVMDENTIFRHGPSLRTPTGKDIVASRGTLYRFLWDAGTSYMAH